MSESDDDGDETAKYGKVNFNSRMHASNFYKHNKPDFTALARKYDDFAQFCTFDAQGKVCYLFAATLLLMRAFM